MRPTISIGLPVYNGEHFLEEAAASLLEQNYRNFELIISDNCSSDRTQEICGRLAEADQRVRYTRNPSNIGAAGNYNRVVDLAEGRYFAWANHDDIWLPDFLERCLAALEKDADAVIAYGRSELIDESGRTMVALRSQLCLDSDSPTARLHQFHDLILDYDRRDAWSQNDGEGLWIPVYGLMRTDVLRQTRCIGSYISSDTVLLEEMLLRGKFAEVDAVLFCKRDHHGRSTREAEAYDSRHVWFTGERRVPRFLFPMWRIFLERLCTVARAPLAPREKAASFSETVLYYMRSSHEHRTLVREILINLDRLTGRPAEGRAAVKKW